MSKALIIIPARMSSSRFPGKPLININGKTMLERVWSCAVKANIGDVYVACCDKLVKDLLIKKKIPYIYTKKNLKSGTDRVYEAFLKVKNRRSYKIIINLQGDIPFLNTNHLRRLYDILKNKNYQMATLASHILDSKKINDSNIVKIAMTKWKKNIFRAIYFSRAPIPYNSKKYYEHIGIYGYTPLVLKTFINLKSSKLESSEKLEQLRALESLIAIYVGIVKDSPISIDTPMDLKKLNKILKKRNRL
ncbi:MAG: 3-deoxy-manno-octulosonate cytidylyltransferase [Pseudomonadota bacterium]|nr:3-deoxy-manno-octulosonate cytidylyltransferase [Pseudomonadota bacterium]